MRLQKVSDLQVLVNLGEVWKSSSLLDKEKEIEQDKTKEENGNKRIKKLLEKEKAVKRKKREKMRPRLHLPAHLHPKIFHLCFLLLGLVIHLPLCQQPVYCV